LYLQDKTWEQICSDMKWHYIRTVWTIISKSNTNYD
jgi:hypothetical protein